jgi:hypothetical protein
VTPIQSAEVSGSGTVVIDHNYGGVDNLTYQNTEGEGIAGATIKAYLKSSYDAGNTGNSFVLASTTTDDVGRWVRPMVLDPGTYTLIYYKAGYYLPSNVTVVVS